jgi:hypothetical protein
LARVPDDTAIEHCTSKEFRRSAARASRFKVDHY